MSWEIILINTTKETTLSQTLPDFGEKLSFIEKVKSTWSESIFVNENNNLIVENDDFHCEFNLGPNEKIGNIILVQEIYLNKAKNIAPFFDVLCKKNDWQAIDLMSGMPINWLEFN